MRILLVCPVVVVALWAATPLRAQLDTVRIDSALARHVRTAQAAFYWRFNSPVRPLAGGRFYTLVGRARTGGDPTAVLLCVGTVGAEPTMVDCLALRTPGRPSGPTADDNTNFFTEDGDYDRDGEPELSVRLAYGRQSYTGLMQHNQLYVIDTQPTLRIAASAYIYIPRGMGPDLELTFEDLNRDGHPDMVVRGEACRPPPEEGSALIGCRPIVRRLIWNARTDSWIAAR